MFFFQAENFPNYPRIYLSFVLLNICREKLSKYFSYLNTFHSPIVAEQKFPRVPGTKKLNAAMLSRRFLWFTPNPVRGFHLACVKKKTTKACRRGGVDNRNFRYLESENDSREREREREYDRRDTEQCDIYFLSQIAIIDDEGATRANKSAGAVPNIYRSYSFPFLFFSFSPSYSIILAIQFNL